MGDIVRCEGLGAISILDLVNILSEPKKNQTANQKSSNQNPESILPIKKPQRRKSLTEKIRHMCPKEGCKRTFCSQVALENHMSRHARKYTCDTCNKTFSEHAGKCKVNYLTRIGKLSGNDSGDFPETFSKKIFSCTGSKNPGSDPGEFPETFSKSMILNEI